MYTAGETSEVETRALIRAGVLRDGNLQRKESSVPGLRLVGKQVVVRDWIAQDIAPYRQALRPGQAWQALDGPYYPRPSAQENERMLERISRRIRDEDWPVPRKTLVIADAATNKLIGRLSWYWQSRETHWLSLGLAIFAASSWGRGLGYEALGLWSQYLFEAMPELVRLDLRTWSGNRRMMGLAEKLGYQLEARAKPGLWAACPTMGSAMACFAKSGRLVIRRASREVCSATLGKALPAAESLPSMGAASQCGASIEVGCGVRATACGG